MRLFDCHFGSYLMAVFEITNWLSSSQIFGNSNQKGTEIIVTEIIVKINKKFFSYFLLFVNLILPISYFSI